MDTKQVLASLLLLGLWGSICRATDVNSARPGIPILDVLHLGSTGVAVKVVNPSESSRYNDEDQRAKAEDLPVIGYSVQFKMLRRTNWVTAHNVTLTGYGFILRGLIPNVTYLIQAASRNQAAQSEYSSHLQITTPKNVKFEPPINGAQNLQWVLPGLLISEVVLGSIIILIVI